MRSRFNCPTTPLLHTLNHRKVYLLTLLLVFLIYCAYTSSTCFSNQFLKGTKFIGRIFVKSSDSDSHPSTNDDELIIILSQQNETEKPPGRTRTCANELSQHSSSRRGDEKGEISAGNRRLPNALIIGVKKSGTRALLEFIRIHPEVRASGCEVHFFDRHYNKGLRWYRRRMPATQDGQLTMEKTPSYFITREVPKRIYNMSPKTKLLLVVRDPVTRAVSDYTQAITKLMTTKRFEELAFVNGSRGEWNFVFSSLLLSSNEFNLISLQGSSTRNGDP